MVTNLSSQAQIKELVRPVPTLLGMGSSRVEPVMTVIIPPRKRVAALKDIPAQRVPSVLLKATAVLMASILRLAPRRMV